MLEKIEKLESENEEDPVDFLPWYLILIDSRWNKKWKSPVILGSLRYLLTIFIFFVRCKIPYSINKTNKTIESPLLIPTKD